MQDKTNSEDMKKEVLDQYDCSDSDYIEEREPYIAPALGSFLIAFSRFEHFIDNVIADLVAKTSHDAGYAIIKELTMMQKVTILRNLVSQIIFVNDSEVLECFLDIYKEIVSIVEFRNEIVHALWDTIEKDDYVRVKTLCDKKNGAVVFRRKRLSPDIIVGMSDSLVKTENMLFELLESKQVI